MIEKKIIKYTNLNGLNYKIKNKKIINIWKHIGIEIIRILIIQDFLFDVPYLLFKYKNYNFYFYII